MKVTLTFTAVFFMFLKRSVSGASLPNNSGVTLFPPQYGILPSLPSGGLPQLPDDTWPFLPGGTLPQFPGGTLPFLPGGTLPQFPGGTLPSLPGGIWPQFPGGTLPSLPKGPLPISPDGASDDDSSIPAIAGVLFTAASKANEVPTVSAQPITDAQRCVNTYNTSTLIAVANAGIGIIQAVSNPGNGIHLALANQLQEQFVANISRCSALEALDNRFNCYDLQISNLRQSIATANNGSGLLQRLKIFFVLKRLATNLANKYKRLQQCLSLVLASTTPELQTTTTDSILSVLNTVSPSIS